MGAFDNIRAALDSQLQTFATAQSLAVAWPNTGHEPTVGTPWIRPTLLPGWPEAAALGADADNYQSGLYQVDIFTPAGEGTEDARDYADAMITSFKRGTTLTYSGVTVRIKRAGIEASRQEPEWVVLPVLIAWFAYTAND
jgi:hypothetical protein